MSADDIVSVSIQAGTSQPSRRAFGTPLVLGYHTRFLDNVKTYKSASAMITDGFTVNDPVYLMASRIFAQNPRPPQVKIGRLPTPGSPHTVELDTTGIVSGETITLTVRSPAGVTTDISVPFDTSASTTATNLATAIDAISGVAASASVNVVTVDADTNGEVWFYEDLVNCAIVDVTGDWGYDTQLAVILNEDADFFAVAIDVNSDTNIDDVAAWVLTNDRIAAFGPQVTNAADYTATADGLMTASNDNAFSLQTKQSRRFAPECAWLGKCLPRDPGSQTWAFKSLAGVSTDPWTDSDLVTIEADNTNHYTTVAGLGFTRQGVMHGGEYIDVRRGLYYIQYNLQADMIALLANNDKIPFTDSGGQQIEAVIRKRLQDAADKGIITEDSIVVSVPLVADVPASDRAARHWTGIEFTATLQGAVHKMTILGNVSV